MLIVTTTEIPGYRIDAVLGMVIGISARAVPGGIGANIGASLSNIGNVQAMVGYAFQFRIQALQALEQHAAQFGANAVIDVNFDPGRDESSEICCYGTAVRISPLTAQAAA
jgi:uncharacterized protein YbjQ (UPF0145 family)